MPWSESHDTKCVGKKSNWVFIDVNFLRQFTDKVPRNLMTQSLTLSIYIIVNECDLCGIYTIFWFYVLPYVRFFFFTFFFLLSVSIVGNACESCNQYKWKWFLHSHWLGMTISMSMRLVLTPSEKNFNSSVYTLFMKNAPKKIHFNQKVLAPIALFTLKTVTLHLSTHCEQKNRWRLCQSQYCTCAWKLKKDGGANNSFFWNPRHFSSSASFFVPFFVWLTNANQILTLQWEEKICCEYRRKIPLRWQ